MALPEAAQRNVQKAHDLMAQQSQARGQGLPPVPGTQPTPPPGPAPVTDTAALQAEQERLNGEVRRLNAANRTLREKYEKETPRLMSENDQLKKRVEELEGVQKRRIEAGEITGITEEDRTLAGPMLDVMTKVARSVAVDEIDTRLKSVNEKLATFDRQHEASYYATLDAGVPGWDATDGSSINDDPKFLNWLQSLDPETNRTRWTLLKQAEAARQGHAIVEIVSAFREGREIGARTAAKPRVPAVDPAQDRGAPPAPPQPQGRTWTGAQINQFYRDKNRLPEYQGAEGKLRAREVERDIFAAQKDGRIVG